MVEGKFKAQAPLGFEDSRRTDCWLVIFVIFLWRNPTIWLWEEQIWFNTDSCHAIQVAGVIEMLIYINKLLFIVYFCYYCSDFLLLPEPLESILFNVWWKFLTLLESQIYLDIPRYLEAANRTQSSSQLVSNRHFSSTFNCCVQFKSLFRFRGWSPWSKLNQENCFQFYFVLNFLRH